MFKTLFRDRWFICLLLVAVFIRLFALKSAWVEQYFSTGIYPGLAAALRWLFGWLPFSIGDLLYLLAFLWVVRKTWRLVQRLRQKKARTSLSWVLLRKYLKLSLLVYIVFSLVWGLNYFRRGIDAQLAITIKEYSVQDLFSLTLLLQQRLNHYAVLLDSADRLSYHQTKLLFQQGVAAYQAAANQYPFLSYAPPSIKPSLYTPVGHWFGFTGYYNPFTAEAQLKTDVPVFIKPFVVTHEIAHQLGYAKENEASFVAYLACKASGNTAFLYAAYFELYRDAISACRQTPNKNLTEKIIENVHPRVRRDISELRHYLLNNQNFVEPLMTGVYDRYLKLNNQPKGKATYNEVLAYLMAYRKEFGREAV